MRPGGRHRSSGHDHAINANLRDACPGTLDNPDRKQFKMKPMYTDRDKEINCCGCNPNFKYIHRCKYGWGCSQMKIKSSSYSRYYTESCNKWRSPSSATQLRNIAAWSWEQTLKTLWLIWPTRESNCSLLAMSSTSLTTSRLLFPSLTHTFCFSTSHPSSTRCEPCEEGTHIEKYAHFETICRPREGVGTDEDRNVAPTTTAA